jgi:hypothetical protein
MTTAENVMKRFFEYAQENDFLLVNVDRSIQLVFTNENIGWWMRIVPTGKIEKIEKIIKPKGQYDAAFIFAKADCLEALLDGKKSLKEMMPSGDFKFDVVDMGIMLQLQPFFTIKTSD